MPATVSAPVDQLANEPGGPVLFDVSTLRFAEPYSGPVLAELACEGVDVVVSDEGMVRQLGERRRADGDEIRRLVLIEGAATWIRNRMPVRWPSSKASTAANRPSSTASARRCSTSPGAMD